MRLKEGGGNTQILFGVGQMTTSTEFRFKLFFQSRCSFQRFIGPDLGSISDKYQGGVEDSKGFIYCIPGNSNQILKIGTIIGIVTLLDVTLPERGKDLWRIGVLVLDGNIYFMPYQVRRMLKINPRNDTLSSVGNDKGWKNYMLDLCLALTYVSSTGFLMPPTESSNTIPTAKSLPTSENI